MGTYSDETTASIKDNERKIVEAISGEIEPKSQNGLTIDNSSGTKKADPIEESNEKKEGDVVQEDDRRQDAVTRNR